MTTLFELCLDTLRLLGGLRTGAATAGSTTTLLDTNLRLEDDDYWNGGTVWIITADSAAPENEYSLITNFTNSTAQISMRAVSAAVEADDIYAVSDAHFPYDQLIDAVNLALQQFRVPRVDTSLTVVAAQTEYTLPAGVQHGRLYDVWVQTNDDANDRRFQRVGEWWTVDTGSGQLLIIPEDLETDMTLRLDYELVNSALSAATDTIPEILETKHIIFRAAEYMLLQQMYRGDEWPYLEERMNYFMAKADAIEEAFFEKIRTHKRE